MPLPAYLSGLRTEELLPEYRTRKDGLDWSHVDRVHGVIRVPALVSKTGHSRIVPSQKNLVAWLDHLQAPTAGPIIKGLPTNAHNERRAKTAGIWKTNGLRHSYGSYRVVQTQNLPQVAMEMGNSIAIIRKHYLEVVTQAKGEEWFAICPPG